MVFWRKSIEWQKQDDSVGFSDHILNSFLWLDEITSESEIHLSDLPLDRVKAAEGENEVVDEADDEDQWFISDTYLFVYSIVCITTKFPVFHLLGTKFNHEIVIWRFWIKYKPFDRNRNIERGRIHDLHCRANWTRTSCSTWHVNHLVPN